MTFCIRHNSGSVEAPTIAGACLPTMPKSVAAAHATNQGSKALGAALAFLSSFVVVSFAVQTIASAPLANDNTVIPHQATLWSALGQS